MRLIDGQSTSEVRKDALRGLVAFPHLIEAADPLDFMSDGVGYPIFRALRGLWLAGKPITALAVHRETQNDSRAVYALILVFDTCGVTENLARHFLKTLHERVEQGRERSEAGEDFDRATAHIFTGGSDAA